MIPPCVAEVVMRAGRSVMGQSPELVKLSLEAASLGKSLPQLIGDYTRDYLRCTGVKK